ncbi:unnamed protein product, partial [Meganyctiphanes norvegica]
RMASVGSVMCQWLLLLISLLLLGYSGGGTISGGGDEVSKFHPVQQKKILTKLLKDSDYDVNEWPDADFGLPTTVYVQMFINSFGSLNAANMDYGIDVFLRQRWHDRRMAFNDTRNHITITNDEFLKRVWKPDTYFDNVKEASQHTVTMPNVLLRVTKTGDILYSMRLRLKLSCYMELQDYPIDGQHCGVNIQSYAYTDDVIKYAWNKNIPIDLPDTLEIAQFDLMDLMTDSFTYPFVTGNFSGVNVTFILKRQNGYHILQTYIPTILIVSISWVSFWLDPNAVPGRVSLGITTLLTLTTLASGIRATLPPVSYVKAIDIWIGTCMIMVFGALLEFTFVNWLANKKIPPGTTTPFKIPAMEEEAACPPPTTYIEYARAIDRLCRALFPGSFVLFNIVYWCYYLLHQHTHLGNDH